jgi:hypothetical protein
MNRRTFLGIAILAAALALCAQPLAAQSVTSATGAGAAYLTSAGSFNGVNLTDLKFGLGGVLSDGAASGDFETTLYGTSVTGEPRTITAVGKPSSGSGQVGSSTTLTGLCTLNMGDGTPTQSGVPFTLLLLTSGGRGSLTLTLGGTTLPAANMTAGSMTVR